MITKERIIKCDLQFMYSEHSSWMKARHLGMQLLLGRLLDSQQLSQLP